MSSRTPEDWAGGDRASRNLADRIARTAGELAHLVRRRPPAAAVDPFENPTPFEELLRGE